MSKRAVYVRGTNNVYRRVDAAPSINSADSADMRQRKQEVDDILNELMECSFQVQALPGRASGQQPVVRRRDLAPAAPREPSLLPRRRPAVLASASYSGASTLDPGPSAPPPPDLLAYADPEPEPAREMRVARPPYVSVDTLVAKGVPFVLGMLTTYMLQVLLPGIAYYLSAALGFLKLGVFWIVLMAALSYYGGMWRVLSVNYRRWLACVQNRIFYDDSAASPAVPAAPDYPAGPAVEPALPEHTVEEEDVEEPLPAPVVTQKVTPFRPQVRAHKEPGHQPIFAHTQEPARRGMKLRLKRGSSPVLAAGPGLGAGVAGTTAISTAVPNTAVANAAPAKTRGSFLGPVPLLRGLKDPSRFYKPLPPVIKMPPSTRGEPDPDLPLVYEVKLSSMDENDPTHHHRAALDRLGTVMSKKLVLGTRANYSKFLANVDQ